MVAIAAGSTSAQAACVGTALTDTCLIESTTDQTIAVDGLAPGNDVFQLGGAANFNFQVNRIGTTYTNWEIFQKVGATNITLINTAGTGVNWEILGGTLTASGGDSIFNSSTVTVTTGTFALAANETIGALTGNAGTTVNLGAFFLTTGGNNATTTYAGNVVGTGGITKEGSGTFTLSGTNTYSGATTINAGTLTASGGNAIGNLSAVNVGTGATLNLTSSETIGSLGGLAGSFVNLNANTLTTGGNNGTTTFGGEISGTGGLIKEGTGNFTLSGENQ